MEQVMKATEQMMSKIKSFIKSFMKPSTIRTAVEFTKKNWFSVAVIYLLITMSITLNDIKRYTGYHPDNSAVVNYGSETVKWLKYIDKSLEFTNSKLDNINSAIRYR